MTLHGKYCLVQSQHALLWSMTVIVAWPLSGPSLMAFDSIKTWQCTFLHSMSHVIPPIGMVIGSFPWHWMGKIVWNNQSMRYCGQWRLPSHGQYLVEHLWKIDSNNLAMNFPTLNVSFYTINWNNNK